MSELTRLKSNILIQERNLQQQRDIARDSFEGFKQTIVKRMTSPTTLACSVGAGFAIGMLRCRNYGSKADGHKSANKSFKLVTTALRMAIGPTIAYLFN